MLVAGLATVGTRTAHAAPAPHPVSAQLSIDLALKCSNTTRAFRCKPASFARFTDDLRDAALNSSCVIARTSVASVRASFSAITARAVNARSVASRETFTFHGHTDWEECRCNHAAIHSSRRIADSTSPRLAMRRSSKPSSRALIDAKLDALLAPIFRAML